MDSWFDLILRLAILVGVIAGGVSLFQRHKAATEEEKWETFEEHTQHFMEAEEIESQRPSGPPSSEAFQFKE